MVTARVMAESTQAEAVGLRPGSDPGLPVTVVHTTADATLAALRTAGRLAEHLHARIVLVATEVIPFRVSLGAPLVPSGFLERRLLALVAGSGIDADEVRIEIFLCRDCMQCLERVLRPRSLLVIGGNRRWWSRERRLGRRLARFGHQVVFADASRARLA